MPRTGLSAPELKEKAVAVTIAAMRRDGFDKVRLTDIAKQLGVSHAALYAHFEDKAALVDAVSAQWLRQVDETLDAICRKPGKSPRDKIHAWMLALHRAKREKVLNDPELYKSFDLHSHAKKPYVQHHLETMRTQLVGLMREAAASRKAKGASPEKMAEVVWESMMAFHHPKLVAHHIETPREPLLKLVLDSVLKGLDLEDS
jgi:AcrR family transcriptional regulator